LPAAVAVEGAETPSTEAKEVPAAVAAEAVELPSSILILDD